MQLIQIGEVRQKTVLEMIHEIADRQFAEIERLKSAAQKRVNKEQPFRIRQRCTALNPR